MIIKIKKDYNKWIKADKFFWLEKREAKYGTLIFLSRVQPCLLPMKFYKSDRWPWVVLENEKGWKDGGKEKVKS